MRATHTFSELEISGPAYDEIRAKLEAAGYQHALIPLDGGVALDMHGIGLTRAAEPAGFVVSQDQLTDADRERLKTLFESGCLGRHTAGRPIILESGKKVRFEPAYSLSERNPTDAEKAISGCNKVIELVEVWPC